MVEDDRQRSDPAVRAVRRGLDRLGCVATDTSGFSETDFPEGFFDRADPSDDAEFYRPPRFVTHLDDRAIAAVGDLYASLGIEGRVLDLCSSWVSHFERPPRELVALGMNAEELAANEQASRWLVHDLNADPALPFDEDHFDDAVCCVSVDYLTRPVAVFRDIARVVRPGGRFVCTFSNRCFPTKTIRGWLASDDETHRQIVARYFRAAGGFDAPVTELRASREHHGDPLYAVWATVG